MYDGTRDAAALEGRAHYHPDPLVVEEPAVNPEIPREASLLRRRINQL